MTFDKIDIYVDLTYGVLIASGMVAMIFLNNYLAAVAYGFGVLLSYCVHIGWRMARFDPDVAEQIEERVEETVEDTVQQTVEENVEETVEETVEKSVEESVDEMQEQVEETVEETVEDTVDNVVNDN